MIFSEASSKNRAVPNAASAGKNIVTTKNRMGQPEQTVTQDGDEKSVLNELDPEPEEQLDEFDITARRSPGGRRGKYRAAGLGQLGDENLPDSHNESRGPSMNRKIDETVQDQSGVSGDFMDSMSGKTDKLGASQTNTGGTFETHQDSTSGKPDDGIQTKIDAMKLGGSQKNTGGSHEEFQASKASKASDGIQDDHSQMTSKLGENDKQKSKGGQHEPFEGSKNKMSEAWTLDNVASIMEEGDVNLQELFDAYTKEANVVTLEEFEQLANAYGYNAPLDAAVLESLMEANSQLMFHEGEDDSGRYWLASEAIRAPITARPRDRGMPGMDKEEGQYDPFAVDLDRATRDPGYADEYDDLGDLNLGEPGMGEPGMGEPGMGEPGMGELGMGEPGMDEPGMGEPGMGELGMNEPGMGDPGMGDPGMGDLGMGEPGMDDPGMGKPMRKPGMRKPGMRNPKSALGLEMVSMGDSILTEMTSSSGIAAPPMGAAMSRGTSVNREKPWDSDSDADVDEDTDEDIPIDECRKCGGVIDNQGCPACALRETHELGVSAPDPSTDSDGHFTSDATTSGLGSNSESVNGAMTQDSSSTKADDGITSELGGMGSKLGQNEKQKNKGAQHEPLKGGSGAMQENISELAKHAKRSIQKGALEIGKNGKFAVSFAVSCEGIKTRRRRQLVEALVDAEELLQAYGPKAVKLMALFSDSEGKIRSKKAIQFDGVRPRDPVVCENKTVFRYPEVANDFADQVSTSGTVCKVERHNWGASVSGRYNWSTAQRAFKDIPALLQEDKSPFA